MIPLCVFMGLYKGFFFADWTKSYITCTVGVGIIGYTMITFGVSSAIFAVVVTTLAKWTGRRFIIAVGGCLTVGVLAAMFSWDANASDQWFLYTFAALWGAVDSIWLTQISAY